MPKSIEWLPENILKEDVEASRRMYDFIERDFDTCIEYVALDSNHFNVYSPRIANIILRICPEILRIFDLILFNQKITTSFEEQPELRMQIVKIHKKKKIRKDWFIDYLKALPELTTKSVKAKTLEEKIKPFEIIKIKLHHKKEPIESVDWWEWGYNALRHRIVREFKESATLKHALFSLAGLYVLHDRLDRDWGRMDVFRSRIFRSEILPYISL